jgi:hypothetical protein
MKKIDLRKELKEIYSYSKKEPKIINIPSMKFLMVDGEGHPQDQDFQNAANIIYTISYILKFKIVRERLDIDYKVMPMELIWTLERGNKTKFFWTMMIMQPDFVTQAMVEEAIQLSKDKLLPDDIAKLRFEEYNEGMCVQAFHHGDYNLMNDTLKKMIEFAEEKNLRHESDTHDIYLNDMRKTKTENLKTIMRLKVYEN